MLRPMIENMQNAVYSQEHAGINATSSYTIGASAVEQAYVPADLEDKPLVSSDNKTVDTLGNKIIALKIQTKDDDGNVLNTSALSEDEQAVIRRVMQVVTSPGTNASLLSSSFPEDSCKILTRVMEGHPTTHMSCLFLMRLLILEEALMFRSGNASVFAMIDCVIARLASAQGPGGFTSVPATVMALCTLANLLSHESGKALVLDRATVAGTVVDIAVAGLSHARVEVRQMSAIVAYNFTMAFTTDLAGSAGSSASPSRSILSGADSELNTLAVQLFCGAMEGVSTEMNTSVRHRRLCVALKLVRIGGQTARSLGRDLGFGDDVSVISASTEAEKLVVDEMKRAFSIA